MGYTLLIIAGMCKRAAFGSDRKFVSGYGSARWSLMPRSHGVFSPVACHRIRWFWERFWDIGQVKRLCFVVLR